MGIGEGTGPPHHRLTRFDFERLNRPPEDFEEAAPAPPDRHPVVVFLHGRRGINELAEILADDVKLMLFGFRFLRQMLFGEMSIALHAETVEKRRYRLAERQRELEREAGGAARSRAGC